jgi:phage gp29-like protein
LDALFFGYSLISLGDIIDGNFAECDIVRRWNISPDRMLVSSVIYSLSGKQWQDPDTNPWHVWVPTKSENGVGRCGYGLFYKIALYEIFLRNTLGYNGDFVELYSQPYRVGKTTKTTESERAELENAIRNMGSNGWAIIDPLDEISFLETSLGGTGWQGYDNFEKRCQAYVSKIVLGHANALDEQSGKLGASQGKDNPVEAAKKAKQIKDGRFVMPFVNQQLFPRMKKFGFKIPEGYKFVYNNDDEKEEQRERQDASNLATAQIAQTMSTAGMQMKPDYFEERTGIPTELIPQPTAEADGQGDINPNDPKKKMDKAKKIKNMMEGLYGK